MSPDSFSMHAPDGPIVLYDGVCGLCHRTVDWLLRKDRRGALRFAPLQGETAAALRQLHGEIPVDLDTVVLVDDGRVYLRSAVFLRAAKHLPMPWRTAWYLRWFPTSALDVLYRFIALIRYRVWGKFDVCRVPDTAERERLLP